MSLPRSVLRRSLIARLVVSFLAVSLVTVALVAAVAFVRARSALRQEITDRLSAAAAVRERQITQWVDHQRTEVEYLARLAEVAGRAGILAGPGGETARSGLAGFLQHTRAMKPALGELFLLSVPGAKVLVSTDSARVGEYRVTDNYFLQGQRGTFVQDVYPSPLTGRPALSIATPLRDPAGKPVALLAAHLNLGELDQIIADTAGLGHTGEAYLIDQYNDFVTSERFGRERYLRGVSSAGITAAVAQRRSGAGAYLNYAGVPVIGAYRWVESRRLAVLVEMRQHEAFAPARRLAGAIMLIGLLSAAVLGFGIYLLARQVARPVLAATAAAERVAGGDFTATAPVTTDDEVGRLAGAFNAMTARLQTLYARQQAQVVALQRAGAMVEESHGLLQTIIDNTPAYLSVARLDGTILLFNTAAAKLYGVDRDACIGRNIRDIVGPERFASSTTAVEEALRTGGPIGREEQRVLNGEERTWYVVRFPVFDTGADGYAVGTIATDITAVKKAEAERRAFAEQIQHTQKLESLGVLAGGIAHDFNNLLTAILGHGHLALSEIPETNGARTDLERIVDAAHRATEMTNQMLAYAGRGKFVIEPVNLNDLVSRMSQLLLVSISKKVELRYDLAPSLPAIQGDPAQLQQVVMNLITNAAEAIGDDVGTITLATAVVRCAGDLTAGPMRGLAAGDYVRVAVADSGDGMDEGTRRRIFEPFFTTKFTGRGLGLAAVQGIVRGHHGALWVDSTPGVGTTFTVYLPAMAAPVPGPDRVAHPAAQARGTGTVLVVDDEEAVRGLAERALTRGGYRVLLAKDGAEAVTVFVDAATEIDVVVLDLTMPVMDGREVLEALRRVDPTVRVVLSSGFTEHDLSSRGDVAGTLFLQKPYRPSQLVERVQELIARA